MLNSEYTEDNFNMAVAALSSISDGVITTDIEGKITFMNQSAEVILGINAGNVIGKEFDKTIYFYNIDTKKPIISPVKKTLEKGMISGLESNTIIITKENMQKYVSATCSPIRAENSEVLGAILVLRDITKIKNNENSNLAERNSLLSIFSYAPIGMILFDNNSTVIRINEAALTYIDQRMDRVLGKRFGDAFHCMKTVSNGCECGCSPECPYCQFRAAIDSAVNEGWSSNNLELFTTLMVNEAEKEFWFKISVTPINFNDSNYAVLSMMDITENKNKEIKLKNSRDYTVNLINQIPSLVWKANKNIEFDYVNKVWSEYTGSTFEQASGPGWTNLVHPEDFKLLMEARDKSAQTITPFQLEARIRRKNGEYRWCLIAGSPYHDMDGEITGFIGSICDINDQKVVEENLRRYRNIIDNGRDIIFFLDLNGNILEANKRASETYGYSIEELKTLNIRDINKGYGSDQHLSFIDKTGHLYEAIHQRKDGSHLQVEVNTQKADLGDQNIILKVVRDITERKKTEKIVLENQMKYRSLFMNMQTGFSYYNIIYGENHIITDLCYKEVNEAFEKLFRVKKKYIINKKHSEVFNENLEHFMKVLNMNAYKLVRGESVHIKEAYLPALSRWFSFAIYSPKENELAVITTDITAIKETELKLIAAKNAAETANKAKSEFLANMSHEIRTPINGVVGMVDLTLLTDLSKEQRENLVTAKSCANSLLNIINDVLDFSKMEAGKLVINNINFDIKELIEEIVKTHTPRTLEKGLELNYSFSSSIPRYVVGDPNRIKQIINNLISNSLKFTDTGGITLTIKKMADYGNQVELKFIVTDTGIGIAQDDQLKLFHSFSQIEESFNKKFGGTGLGLAISKNLTEMMGGKIRVESSKGVGSTFYFTLSCRSVRPWKRKTGNYSV